MQTKSYVLSVLALCGGLTSTCSHAGPLGSSPIDAAFSARQVLIQSPWSASGLYWFDPDGAGAMAPFVGFADQVWSGGGWTLVHERENNIPDMDGFFAPVLAAYGPSSYRVISNTFAATFSASSIDTQLNPFNWTYSSGTAVNALSLGLAPNQFSLSGLLATRQNDFTVYVRENITPAYVPHPVTPVPEPEAYAMLMAGLGMVGAVVRRRKQKQ